MCRGKMVAIPVQQLFLAFAGRADITHLFGPLLMVLFDNSLQLTKMMGVTKDMGRTVVEIGLPLVMAEDTLILGEDTNLIEGDSTTFLVGIKIPVLRS